MKKRNESDLIQLLNEAVARELQVSVQYSIQHAKMEKILKRVKPENILFTPGDSTTYDMIGKFLKEFAIQEMKHAGQIMERIYLLGGDATTKSKVPKIGDSLKEFAQAGFEAEKEALQLYRDIINLAGDIGDRVTREMFEEIYRDEEEHYFKFEELLDFDDLELDTPTAPAAQWQEILTEDYFELLNQAAAGEISAIIQYTNQHEKAAKLIHRKRNNTLEVIKNSNKAEVVSTILRKVFLQEMEHLEKIAERIYLLGGEVTVSPDPLPVVGKTPDDWLRDNRKAEDDTIILYRKIIEKSSQKGDYRTRYLFEQIIIEEDEHFYIFDDFFA